MLQKKLSHRSLTTNLSYCNQDIQVDVMITFIEILINAYDSFSFGIQQYFSMGNVDK